MPISQAIGKPRERRLACPGNVAWIWRVATKESVQRVDQHCQIRLPSIARADEHRQRAQVELRFGNWAKVGYLDFEGFVSWRGRHADSLAVEPGRTPHDGALDLPVKYSNIADQVVPAATRKLPPRHKGGAWRRVGPPILRGSPCLHRLLASHFDTSRQHRYTRLLDVAGHVTTQQAWPRRKIKTRGNRCIRGHGCLRARRAGQPLGAARKPSLAAHLPLRLSRKCLPAFCFLFVKRSVTLS